MTIEEVIKEAVASGWNNKYAHFYCPLSDGQDDHAFIDPLFWQALGRARGWKGIVEYVIEEKMEHESSLHIDSAWEVWQYHQHRFIDALAEGRSVEEFFKEL